MFKFSVKGKPRILLVERESHYSLVPHLHRMLSHNFSVHIYIPIAGKRRVTRVSGADYIFYRHSHFSLYIRLLTISWRYDYFYISTPPQQIFGKSSAITLFSFLLLTKVLGKKIIIQVRDNSFFIPKLNRGLSRKKISSFILRYSISSVRCLAFESETLRANFHLMTAPAVFPSFVSYTYYSDTFSPIESAVNDEVVRIGILGAVEDARRDYDLMFDAFFRIQEPIRRRLRLIFLGQYVQRSIPAVISLGNLVDVVFQDDYISDMSVLKLGSSCDFLLSPLRKELGYGVHKGSGSFGDAILLRRRLVIPRQVDLHGEFSSFSLYFSDSGSLATVINSLVEEIMAVGKRGGCSFSLYKYSSSKVAAELAKLV